MSLTRPRYALIERRVGDILETARVTQPPVPIEAIVRAHREITVRYSDLQEVSGLVIRKGATVIIGVNKSHSVARKRFTLVHEFGHVLFHEGKELRFDTDFRVNLRSDASSKGIDVEEVEANFFAASLLMPRRFLDNDPRTETIEVEDAEMIRNLARCYAVSPQAMGLRLLNLYGRRLPIGSQPGLSRSSYRGNPIAAR